MNGLLGTLGTALGWFVVKVLGFLGFTAVTYSGITGLLTVMSSYFAAPLAQLPPEVTQLLPMLRIDECMSLMLSGHAFKLSRSGLGAMVAGGTVRRVEA